MLVLRLLVLSTPVLAIPSEYEMGILGLLGADSNTSTAQSPSLAPVPTHVPTLGLFTRPSVSPSAKPIQSTSRSSMQQSTPTLWTDSTVTKTVFASMPTVAPASAESNAIDHSSKTWQAVGIAIISVLFIVASVACAMFFDRLWRLLRDVVCCTSRHLDSEEYIDCEKQNWDAMPLSSLPSDPGTLREDATAQARVLPWNNNDQDWQALHRQPSRRSDHIAT